jgi:hypothetical protein
MDFYDFALQTSKGGGQKSRKSRNVNSEQTLKKKTAIVCDILSFYFFDILKKILRKQFK